MRIKVKEIVPYELTVLYHPDFEMNTQPVLDMTKELVEKWGGKITETIEEGKRPLSYRVMSQDYAIYVFYTIDIPRENVAELSRELNTKDEVLRYLIVQQDNRLTTKGK